MIVNLHLLFFPANCFFSDYFKAINSKSFAFYPTDALKVANISSGFQNKSSCDLDNIPVNIMKLSINAIAKRIADIINCILVKDVFPDLLKLAIVHPIYKNGVRSDFQNYRSISVLLCFSKIFEKVVFNRLLHFLDSNNILCNIYVLCIM